LLSRFIWTASRFSLPCGILCWIVYWAIFVESLSPSRVGTFLLTSSHFCSIYSRYVCASNHASWGEQNSSYLLMNIRSGWFHSGKLSCSFSFCTLTWRNQLSLNWLNLKNEPIPATDWSLQYCCLPCGHARSLCFVMLILKSWDNSAVRHVNGWGILHRQKPHRTYHSLHFFHIPA
jgi:hypothetical protein